MEAVAPHQYVDHYDLEEYDETVELVFYDDPEGSAEPAHELDDEECGSSEPVGGSEPNNLCQRDYNFDVGSPNSLSGSAHILHIWWENGADRFDCGYSHVKYQGLTVPICFQVPLHLIERFLGWLSGTAQALPTMDQWYCTRSALGDLNQIVSGAYRDPHLVQHIFSTIRGMGGDELGAQLAPMTPFPADMLPEMFQQAVQRWQPSHTVPTSISTGAVMAERFEDTGHHPQATAVRQHPQEEQEEQQQRTREQHQQFAQHPAHLSNETTCAEVVNDYDYDTIREKRDSMSEEVCEALAAVKHLSVLAQSHTEQQLVQPTCLRSLYAQSSVEQSSSQQRGRSDSQPRARSDSKRDRESVELDPLVVVAEQYRAEEPLPHLTSTEWRRILEMESVVSELEPVAELVLLIVRFSSMADSVLITVLEGHQQRLVVNSSKQQTCVWGVCATSLEESICKAVFSRVGRTIEEQRGRFREVEDTFQHPELCKAPLVVDGPCIRYYLGFELIPGLAYICLLGCTAGRPPKISQQVAFKDFCGIMQELCSTKRTSVERLYSTMIKLRQEHPEATCWKFSDFTDGQEVPR